MDIEGAESLLEWWVRVLNSRSASRKKAAGLK
jgi:hypothetical protein